MGFSLPYSESDTCHILLVQTVDMAISNSKGVGKCGKIDGILSEHSPLCHILFGPPDIFLFSVLRAVLFHFLA